MWADISKIIRETVRTLGQLIAGMFSSSEGGKGYIPKTPEHEYVAPDSISHSSGESLGNY